MRKILVILGSTSTGKTDLALQFAKKFNGELVSCDSRQVYCGLDIGTGKMPGNGQLRIDPDSVGVDNGPFKKGKGYWEIEGVKIWMYDVADPKKQYTVYNFVKDALRVIEKIRKRGKLPIVVGGTGLYLKALIDGLPNLAIPIDKNLRKKLEKLSKEKLQEKLQEIAPDKWRNLNESDRENPRRLIRAIEIASQTEAKDKVDKNATAVAFLSREILKIGLTAPRQILYQRIDERVVSRIDQGMIEEAKNLHKSGLSYKRMRQLGLEYGVLADYLTGTVKTKEELIRVLQGKIHGYARRQITWFKRGENVVWFDIVNKNYIDKVEKRVAKWYDGSNYAAQD